MTKHQERGAQFERDRAKDSKSLEDVLKVTNAQIVAAQQENFRLLKENSSLTEEKEAKEQQLQYVNLKLTEAQQNKVSADEEVEKLIAQKAVLEQSLEILNSEIESKKVEKDALIVEIDDKKTELAGLNTEIAAKKEELEKANQTPARIAELEKSLAALLADMALLSKFSQERRAAWLVTKIMEHPTVAKTDAIFAKYTAAVVPAQSKAEGADNASKPAEVVVENEQQADQSVNPEGIVKNPDLSKDHEQNKEDAKVLAQ